MSRIESIDTHYDGHKFRSRIEAKWAVFFNSMDIEYLYEPEGFELPSGDRYLPDFYLPDVGMRSTEDTGVWIEVKSIIDSDSGWDGEPFDTLTEFAKAKKEPVALLVGEVGNGVMDNSDIYEIQDYDGNILIDHPMVIVECVSCGRIKIEFQESNYMTCEQCYSRMAGHASDQFSRIGSLKIEGAVDDANYARFEHGERP